MNGVYKTCFFAAGLVLLCRTGLGATICWRQNTVVAVELWKAAFLTRIWPLLLRLWVLTACPPCSTQPRLLILYLSCGFFPL